MVGHGSEGSGSIPSCDFFLFLLLFLNLSCSIKSTEGAKSRTFLKKMVTSSVLRQLRVGHLYLYINIYI